MKTPLLLALLGLASIAVIPSAMAQTTAAAATAAAATQTAQPVEVSKDKVENSAKESSRPGNSAGAVTQWWLSAPVFPLVRLAGIVVILGLFLWWIDLPQLMKADTWTDRTVIALIIIFGFATACLIDVDEKALTALKDVTLIVVGFYFGASKTASPTPKP